MQQLLVIQKQKMEAKAIYNKTHLAANQLSSKIGMSGVIGIDFGATQLRAALVTDNGMGHIESRYSPNQGTAGDVWAVISELIHAIIHENGDNLPQAICIGVPSVVDIITGTVYDIQHIPACKELPLGKLIRDEFGVLALINNDANVFALGEYYFGEGTHLGQQLDAKDIKRFNSIHSAIDDPSGKVPSDIAKTNPIQITKKAEESDHKLALSTSASNSKNTGSLVGLTLGTGLGAGLILGGKLYCGKNCGAGEIGCLPYLDANLERYVSGAFFKKDGLTGKDYYNMALNDDAKAIGIFKEFGFHLGQAIKMTMYAYDPDMIVLGGSVSRAFNLYQSEMFKAMQDFDYPVSLQKIKVYPSSLQHGAILGAASLYYDYQKFSV